MDSEDLPLSISREKPQDSRLLVRIRKALVKRVLKHLNDQATSDPAGFKTWFAEFGVFLKEGVCRDHENQVRSHYRALCGSGCCQAASFGLLSWAAWYFGVGKVVIGWR